MTHSERSCRRCPWHWPRCCGARSQGVEARGGSGNPSRWPGHLGLGASRRGQGGSLIVRRQPMIRWLVVLAMVGMVATVDLDPTQIRRRFLTWMVGGATRAPVKAWRISAGVPTAASVPASREIGTTRLPVKTTLHCGFLLEASSQQVMSTRSG